MLSSMSPKLPTHPPTHPPTPAAAQPVEMQLCWVYSGPFTFACLSAGFHSPVAPTSTFQWPHCSSEPPQIRTSASFSLAVSNVVETPVSFLGVLCFLLIGIVPPRAPHLLRCLFVGKCLNLLLGKVLRSSLEFYMTLFDPPYCFFPFH